MLYRFELGKRYIRIFPVTIVAALALTAIGGLLIGYKGLQWGFPTTMLWLAASQLRSGVALDRMWVAKYPRGTAAFYGMMAWGFLLPITWTSYVAWMMFAEGKM